MGCILSALKSCARCVGRMAYNRAEHCVGSVLIYVAILALWSTSLGATLGNWLTENSNRIAIQTASSLSSLRGAATSVAIPPP